MSRTLIIFSESINKFYVGESENPERRLELHNQHYFAKGFTKAANDWRLKLKFPCENKVKAKKLERFIKKMKSRRFIENIINKPEQLKEIYFYATAIL